jgi:hypothetical protein
MSNADYKNVEALTPADLERASVWRFVHAPSLGDTVVGPMKRLPVQDLTGKIVGSRVQLANGSSRWALLGTTVAPFHSSQNPGVYHVCSNCTEGNNIERQNRRPGRPPVRPLPETSIARWMLVADSRIFWERVKR